MLDDVACGADLGVQGVEGDEDIVEGGDGGGGEALQAMAVVGAKGAQLLLGQRLGELGEGRHAVVTGKLGRRRDGHDGRRRVAPPAPAAKLRNRARTLEQAAKAIGGQRRRVAFASPMRSIVEGTQLLARVVHQG